MRRLRVLVTAPHLDGADVGETYTAFMLLREVAKHAELTVVCYECRYGPPLREQLPEAEVITFREPSWVKPGTFVHQFKPQIPVLNDKIKRWVKRALRARRSFDLAHQILPRAPRYTTPLRHFRIPYIVGSLGGALPTPDGFRDEVTGEDFYKRLRMIDKLRFHHDPFLRASYGNAELVIGVAPYMEDVLAPAPIRRFDSMLGIGIDSLPSFQRTDRLDGRLRLLHVGRAIRTKGLRDVVRAMQYLNDLPGVTLTSIGDGEDIEACCAEANDLGVSDRVHFLGRLSREIIEDYYRDSDVFVFPSFRESMGGVLYEAMRWGLPAITVDYGGPGYVTDDACAIRLPLSTPEALSRDLADAIRTLNDDPDRRMAMGAAARRRVADEGLWENKARRLLALYESVLADRRVAARPASRGGKRE